MKSPNIDVFSACFSGDYRYHFNGKESDDEMKGSGNSYDFGARMYDSRLGRWMTIDPLQARYPNLSPYNFVQNSPLIYVDPNGEIIRVYISESEYYDYTPGVKPDNSNAVLLKVHEAVTYNMNTATGKEVWNTLHTAEQVVEIRPQADTENKYDSQNLGQKTKDGKVSAGTIFWDYNTPIQVTTETGVDDTYGGFLKGYLSPSTTLIHEAGHAMEAIAALNSGDPKKVEDFKAKCMGQNAFGADDQYDTQEEKRNIESIEQQYVREINAWEQENNKTDPQYQPLRYNHKARDGKDVSGVNKIPDNKTYLEWRKIAEKQGKTINDGIKSDKK